MQLPVTAAGLIVIVLGILPGVPGDAAYRALAGVSRREKETTHLLRLLTLSVMGVMFYALAASRIGLPAPAYLNPQTFAGPGLLALRFDDLAVAYAGHSVGAIAAALVGAGVNRILDRIKAVSPRRDAWEHFVRCAVPGHWITVTLSNEETYAGILDHADVTGDPESRDLLLVEPYRYNAETKQYDPTFQQFLFLRGQDVVSIAAVYEPSQDKRRASIGANPFERRDDGRQNTRTTTEITGAYTIPGRLTPGAAPTSATGSSTHAAAGTAETMKLET